MKRFLIKLGIVLAIMALLGWFSIPPLKAYWQNRNKPTFRDAAVTRGEVIATVNSTGTIKPVLNVQVGAFVSGPITDVRVDFNDRVKAGQLLARVDPMIYKAQRNQAYATLECANADLLQANAKLEQTRREWKRCETLRPQNAVSDLDYDVAKSNFETAQANVSVSKANIEKSKAALALAEANVAYTSITSPVDGTIIDRKVDPGQTVAAQFQTPELFKVAPDMDKRMHIYASVDEADIGLIRDAQKREQPVMFTIDAYPNDLFKGKIFQIRLNPTTTQNVVTYPVVVESSNPELKLLPGMTVNLSFQIDKHENVLRVPNAALRFYPKAEHVRKEDQKILEGDDRSPAAEDARPAEGQRSAMDKAEASKKRNRRHVWIVDGELLAAVEVVVGISDGKNSEIISGQLKDGQKVVTGVSNTP